MRLTAEQIQQFKIDGYLLLPQVLSSTQCQRATALTLQHLQQRVEPFELEAHVKYPGAPKSEDAEGGDTIRRLLHAYDRDPMLADIARMELITRGVAEILQTDSLFLNPNHHNCVMTKQPEFSSETLWHRDTRYWNFSDKYLVNVWYALGDEQLENGAMKILPGSHRWEVQEDALDEAQFLRLDHPFNQQRLDTQRVVALNAGDALLFSAHCFHAAGKNTTHHAKYSLVYTYHGGDTQPIDNSNSARSPAIRIL